MPVSDPKKPPNASRQPNLQPNLPRIPAHTAPAPSSSEMEFIYNIMFSDNVTVADDVPVEQDDGTSTGSGCVIA
ncbi:hypothetical protein M408DRAFT_22324 [Serendipita vermifera MAFF 305830]|uniref:Uncharacterized protein n=1 Tax=Serendipita vermifera MAFF 305830 TaxID=933852 RepID=A0A0C3BFS2_SERVB|nr:hypothetical protein M408DRAFT_22324 [Serendipita vermifera MAFF 305830]